MCFSYYLQYLCFCFVFFHQKYKELLGRKDEAVVSSRESTQASDGPRPGSEPAGDCFDTNQHCDDSVLGINATSPGTTENKQQREEEQPEPTSLSGAGSQQQEEETLSQATAELPAAHEGHHEPVAIAVAAEDTNKEEGKEAPAALGRTKAAPKRRSGRAANRRWGRDEMSKLRTLLRRNICE